MDVYIDMYGKDFMRDLLDIILISRGYVSNSRFREILIKNQLIKPTTKQIYCDIYYHEMHNKWNIQVKNGRGTTIIRFCIYDYEIPQLIKQLK